MINLVPSSNINMGDYQLERIDSFVYLVMKFVSRGIIKQAYLRVICPEKKRITMDYV